MKFRDVLVGYVDTDKAHRGQRILPVRKGIASIRLIRCPVCLKKGIRVRATCQIGELYGDEEEIQYLILKGTGSPRHSWYLHPMGSNSRVLGQHTKYAGWHGEHTEYILVKPSRMPRDVFRFKIVHETKYGAFAEDSRGYKYLLNGGRNSLEFLYSDEEGFSDIPHYSCVVREIRENMDFLSSKAGEEVKPAIVQGHLEVYDLEGFEPTVKKLVNTIISHNLNMVRDDEDVQIYDHTIYEKYGQFSACSGIQLYELCSGWWILNNPFHVRIRHPEHEEIIVPYFRALLYHPVPQDEGGAD